LKNEDPVLKTNEDSAYTALVDEFMDTVMKSWRNPNPNMRVDEEAHQKQADRFAELALKRYNKNKNNKVIILSMLFPAREADLSKLKTS
jgi:hypothetical protein